MNRENIERLALDAAFGELSEDAGALLDDYLAAHPETRRWAREMEKTCATVQAAVAAQTGAGRRVVHRPSRRVVRIHRPTLVRWAAVAALALLVGAVAGRWSAPQTTGPEERTTLVRNEPSEPAREPWQRMLDTSTQGLWRTKALALLRPTAPASTPQTSRESLWGTYRRYIKETRDDRSTENR